MLIPMTSPTLPFQEKTQSETSTSICSPRLGDERVTEGDNRFLTKMDNRFPHRMSFDSRTSPETHIVGVGQPRMIARASPPEPHGNGNLPRHSQSVSVG